MAGWRDGLDDAVDPRDGRTQGDASSGDAPQSSGSKTGRPTANNTDARTEAVSSSGGTLRPSSDAPHDSREGIGRVTGSTPLSMMTSAVSGEDSVVPGQVIFGRYRVERMLGHGGMGTVWLVRHIQLDAPRALKLLVSNTASDPLTRERFRREARIMARLSHPNAVSVHDAWLTEDAAFIEMEYINGWSLDRLLKPGVPMALEWSARLILQLCDVLQ
jgi:serine/threonine-protein kinase